MKLREILKRLKEGRPVPYDAIVEELGKYERVVVRYGGGWMRTFVDLLGKSDPINLIRLLRCMGDVLLEYEKFVETEEKEDV